MNTIFTNNIGDLSEAPRVSFYRFLIKGMSEEFQHFPNPFITKIHVPNRTRKISSSIYFYPNEVKIEGPYLDIESCLLNNLTYSIQLYVKAEYSYFTDQKDNFITKEKYQKIRVLNLSKSKKIKIKIVRILKDVFFGEVPLMTEEGTFIVKGCERIVISQIIRSPGVYFRKELNSRRKFNYTATVISNKGNWTKFILDEYAPKCHPRTEEILEDEYAFDNLLQEKHSRDRIYIRLDEFKAKKSRFKRKQQESILEKNRIHLFEFFQFFGLSFQEILDSVKHPFRLHSSFFIKKGKSTATFRNRMFLLMKLFFNHRSGCFSIGEIGRYKINRILDMHLPKELTYLTAQDFLGILDGLLDLKYYDRSSDDIDHIKNKQIRSVGELLQHQIRIGFYRLEKSLKSTSSLDLSLQEEFDLEFEFASDPEDWIVDPRQLTSVFKEFFQTSELSHYMDQINPLSELTQKRKISVFGPNGLQRDHISNVIRDIHPSQYGRLCPIETAEGENAGLIMSASLYGRISSYGWIETPYFLMENAKVFSDQQPVFLNPEQESTIQIAFGDSYLNQEHKITTEYVAIKDDYLFSVQKVQDVDFITMSPLQIVSLGTALIPFLEHNDANRALMGSNMQRQAAPLLYPQKPIIGTGFESIAILDSGMVVKNYCQGIVRFSSSTSIRVMDKIKQEIHYELRKYFYANQGTAFNQRPIVWTGENVFSGQIIADGPGTVDGEISLGRNLTIAYMPWEGYNYEDAIILNERLILEDSLTSLHIDEQETSITYGLVETEKITNELSHLTTYITRHLGTNGIVQIGSYVKEHDILVGKVTVFEQENTPESRLMTVVQGQTPIFRDSSLKVPRGSEGRVIDIRNLFTTIVDKDDPLFSSSCETIRIYIAQIRKIQIGDKLAGRHGNKGIISKILGRQDMPFLPDGTQIDIVFNPLGVPSRMNVGQIFECLLGLAGEKLQKRFKISPFDEIYGEEASRILVNQKLKQAAIENDCTWLFHPIFPGKILLRDGRTGESFDNPITVGKSYILKLLHLVEDKIHARATGPYAMVTEQPLAGKSQNGGQRFGEMEVWALEAYGCANTLQELLTIKSDDIDGRNDMYEAILVRKKVAKPTPSIPESFILLIRELNSLGFDFSFRKFETKFHSYDQAEEIERDLFADLENRLKLRALISRKKTDELADPTVLQIREPYLEKEESVKIKKLKETVGKKILQKTSKNEKQKKINEEKGKNEKSKPKKTLLKRVQESKSLDRKK